MINSTLRAIPKVDYRKHPGYGPLLAAIPLSERLGATRKFFGTFRETLAEVRRERWAPAEPDDNGARFAEDYRRFWEAGIIALRMTPQERERLVSAAAPDIAALNDKRSSLKPSERTFDTAVRKTSAAVHEATNDILTAHGVLDIASKYLNRPRCVVSVYAYVSDPGDHAVTNIFSDIGMRDPATVSMHIDATYRALKAMIYLSDVGPENGPFRYVRGSQRMHRSVFEEAVRRANDRILGHGTALQDRRFTCALPSFFRQKGQFGNDLMDDHPEVAELLAAEWSVLSSDGDLILFDNRGIHRGALIQSGQRRVLQVLIKPQS